MLRTTWERMALKNHRAQDVDLLSEVMDDDPKTTKVIQIVANLAKCMIPRNDKKFDTELGKDFEDTLTKASKQSLARDEKPKSLQHFISKGFEQNEKNHAFTILETKDYEDADYIYSDLDLAELKGFQPSKEPAYNPYDKITRWIVARGELIVAE